MCRASRLFWSTVDPRRRTVYTLKITEVHPKVVHAPTVVMNDMTIVHDVTDPQYDPVLAAKYSVPAPVSPDTLSETSTVSATEADDVEPTTVASRPPMSESFRQEKAAHFVATQRLTRGRGHWSGTKLSRSLPVVAQSPKQRQPMARSTSLHTDVNHCQPVMSSPSVSGLSQSTLKLLGFSSAAKTTVLSSNSTALADSMYPSTSGVGDSFSHNELLLTMAKRLNDAAARSSRVTGSPAATPSGLTQNKPETTAPVSCNSSTDLPQSMQTDGPPFHDPDDDVDSCMDTSAVDFTSEDGQSGYITVDEYVSDSVTDEKCDPAPNTAASSDPNMSSAAANSSDDHMPSATASSCDQSVFPTTADSCRHNVSPDADNIDSVDIQQGESSQATLCENVVSELAAADSRCDAVDGRQLSTAVESVDHEIPPDTDEVLDVSPSGEQVLDVTHSNEPDLVDRDGEGHRAIGNQQLSTNVCQSRSSLHLTTSQPVKTSSGIDLCGSSSSRTGSRAKMPRVELCDIVKSGFAVIGANKTCQLKQISADVMCNLKKPARKKKDWPLNIGREQNTSSVTSSTSTLSSSLSESIGSLSAASLCPVSALVTMATTTTVASQSLDSAVGSCLASAVVAMPTATTTAALMSTSSTDVELSSLCESITVKSCVVSEAESTTLCLASAAVAMPTAAVTMSSTGELSSSCESISVTSCVASEAESTASAAVAVTTESPTASASSAVAMPVSMAAEVHKAEEAELYVKSVPVGDTDEIKRDTGTSHCSDSVDCTQDPLLPLSVNKGDGDDCSFAHVDSTSAANDDTLPQSSHCSGGISTENERQTLSSEPMVTSNENQADPATLTVTEPSIHLSLVEDDTNASSTMAADTDIQASFPLSPDPTTLTVTEPSVHVSMVPAVEDDIKDLSTTCDSSAADPDIQAPFPLLPSPTAVAVASADDSGIVLASAVASQSLPITVVSHETNDNITTSVHSSSSSFTSSSSSAAAAVNDSSVSPPPPTCSVSSLQQLLASAQHSQPFFVRLVPHGLTEAAGVAVTSPPISDSVSPFSAVIGQLSSVGTLHSKLLENETLASADISTNQTSASCNAPTIAVSTLPGVCTGAGRIKRLLLGDDGPTAKRRCVIDDLPVPNDGTTPRQQSLDSHARLIANETGSSLSCDDLRTMSTNESGYRLARALTNSRDVWAIPRTAATQPGTQPPASQAGTQPPAQHSSYSVSTHPISQCHTKELQISLRSTAQPPTHPGPQPTVQHGTQPRDLTITLRSGTQPAVLSDRSNCSSSIPVHGHHSHHSHLTSRSTHKGLIELLNYLLSYLVKFLLCLGRVRETAQLEFIEPQQQKCQ